ncbi:ABC transporter ATP-binding protein [Actinomadura rugatobispora]|uniref:ABC transporter ATP-binding protein n=1 Tax=Actinomadura rugatobispora TaxID=1994 RepID=A0ABW1ADX8_9ACTN|nr:ABC transporter ATP-binding protein [Actinomadura rugatobispora]
MSGGAAREHEGGEALAFRGVRKSFSGRGETLRVLDGVDFAVEQGEFVSVVGPSGCGKSTLLNMAGGFESPDAGRVLAGGAEVGGPSPARGVVFQQYAIFPWLTVADNIAFGLRLGACTIPRSEHAAIVARYVDLMGLTGFERAYPKELSGGMRQRVAIARAYAPDPDVLLMDEPFAALDAQTREFMQELLHGTQLAERKTVLLITHSVEEAIFLSHRVVVMSARPAKVCEVVDVGIGMPRTAETRLTPEFIELRRHLEGVLRSQSSNLEKGTAA